TRAQRALRPDLTLVGNIYNPASQDRSFARWLADPERALALHARFNAEIEAAAREQGATLVDLCAAFSGEPGWIVDRIEPSADGARAIARLFQEAILARGFAP